MTLSNARILLISTHMYSAIAIFIVICIAIWIIVLITRPRRKQISPMPEGWKKLMHKHVEFYRNLEGFQKIHFEERCMMFLSETDIVGVGTTVAAIDKIFLSASATIPIFAFADWHYTNLTTINVYPDTFNLDFKTQGPSRNINGLVGTGFMADKMYISQKSLRHGFLLEGDKRNTAIHEFVHLIDMMDGEVDGIPKILMEQQHMVPWLMMMDHTINEMIDGKIDIRDYGATSRIEFFAVLAEYFFERPKLLKDKHPELYDMLEMMFKQDMRKKVKG